MTIIDLAIVIPTLNEEKFVGTLLDSIFYQTIWPKDVFVIDAESTDRTQEVVEKHFKMLPQLQFRKIPKYSISRQRNLGAKLTNAKHVLFLDADMKLKERDTLSVYFHEVNEKNPDIAVAANLPLSTSWRDRVLFLNLNMLIKAAKPFYPWAPGMNIYVKRDSFNKVGGFDDEVKVAEDIDLVQRMVKEGMEFEFLEGPKVHTSVRRFLKEGRRRYIWKLFKGFIAIQRKGFREAEIDYEFGEWNTIRKEKNLFERLLKQVQKQRFASAILKILK